MKIKMARLKTNRPLPAPVKLIVDGMELGADGKPARYFDYDTQEMTPIPRAHLGDVWDGKTWFSRRQKN